MDDNKDIKTIDNQDTVSFSDSEIASEIAVIIADEIMTENLGEPESCDMISTAELAIKFDKNKRFKQRVLYYTLFTLLTATVIVFTILTKGFPDYAKALCTVGVVVLVGFSIYFLHKNKQKLLKLFFVLLICFACFSLIFFVFEYNGWMELFTNEELLRQKINEHGVFAIPIFIVLQFLQSTILPIPSSVTTFVGAKLFGGFLGSIYSLIGIIPASILAFFIGRYAGYRLVLWMVGKDSLEKALKLVKGRDKIVLTLMFILPLFPDDILCFVAGFSTMSVLYYTIMLIVSRSIQVFTTSFFLGEGIIPLNTWWGILIWVLIAIAVVWLFYICVKKGDKIERFFITRILKKEYNESSAYIDKLLHIIDKYDMNKKQKQIEKIKRQYKKRLEKNEINKC